MGHADCSRCSRSVGLSRSDPSWTHLRALVWSKYWSGTSTFLNSNIIPQPRLDLVLLLSRGQSCGGKRGTDTNFSRTSRAASLSGLYDKHRGSLNATGER
jgi:hypothetical protein